MAMPEVRRGQFLDVVSVVRTMREQRFTATAAAAHIGLPAEYPDLLRFITPLSRISLDDPMKEGNFGTGNAGRRALSILKTVSTCEALAEKSCEQSPKLTLDFDVFGDLDQRAFCLDHLESAMVRIREELAAIGNKVSFGVNGWGRA